MPVKLLHLVSCPYCPDEIGEIIIDAEALDALRAESEPATHLEITRDPKQRIFTFNSSGSVLGPCEHLLVMHGACIWTPTSKKRVRHQGCLDYDWSHEVLARKQTHGDVEEYLDWFDVRSEGSLIYSARIPAEFRPETRWEDEWFGREWPSHDRNIPMRCSVDGRAVFVANAEAFCDEVLALIPKHQEWLIARKDHESDYDVYEEIEIVNSEEESSVDEQHD